MFCLSVRRGARGLRSQGDTGKEEIGCELGREAGPTGPLQGTWGRGKEGRLEGGTIVGALEA